MKIDWSLDLGPMNVWYEFEEDLLKTVECAQEKTKLAPSWSQM